jgi:hypothetical protein
MTNNLFPLHLDWTDSTCYYVAAIDSCAANASFLRPGASNRV